MKYKSSNLGKRNSELKINNNNAGFITSIALIVHSETIFPKSSYKITASNGVRTIMSPINLNLISPPHHKPTPPVLLPVPSFPFVICSSPY